MPIPLFNSVASWFLKKRIHQMELFMKYPNEVQQELLHGLLNSATKTEVGKANDFDSIKNYSDFKNRLPIVGYEDIVDQIERCREGEQISFGQHPSSGLPNLVEPPMLKANSSPSVTSHWKIVITRQEKTCFRFITTTMKMLKFWPENVCVWGGAVNCIKTQVLILEICRPSSLTTSLFGQNWAALPVKRYRSCQNGNPRWRPSSKKHWRKR